MTFTPFPNLVTERLVLRQLSLQDENEIFFLRSDDRVLEYIDNPKAESVDDARKFIEKINNFLRLDESVLWAICLKGSATLIGTICFWNIEKQDLTAEIGYVLHPDKQGQGIMQEAIQPVIEYGFSEMKLKSIAAHLKVNNIKSLNLLKRNGFVLTKECDDENYVLYTRLP